MMLETVIYTLSLAVIVTACISAVLSPKFDDNLVQRIGLAVACIGATVRLLDTVDLLDASHHSRHLLTYGVSIFCIGTAYKFWKKP